MFKTTQYGAHPYHPMQFLTALRSGPASVHRNHKRHQKKFRIEAMRRPRMGKACEKSKVLPQLFRLPVFKFRLSAVFALKTLVLSSGD